MILNSTLTFEDINLTYMLEARGELESIDDFAEIFDGFQIKIIVFVLWLIMQTFSNMYQYFFILFEKYGGDPLKRSIS